MSRRPTLRPLEQAPAAAPAPGPPPLVARPLLVERLADASRRRLTLVVAPTGYGKTTLLAQWAATERRRVAWLPLAPADAEPRRLWPRIARAALAGEAAEVDAAPADRALALLLDALADGQELVLVLDDLHALGGACDEAVGYFVERLPEHVAVVLAARSAPALELGSLPVRGEVAVLGARDLRLDRAALAAAAGAGLSDAELDELERLTEGWPAAVRLALAWLRETGRLDGFSGARGAVADYLEEEALAGVGRELRRFLVRTSVLERLTAPLCDALLGRGDSAERLAQAARAGLLLEPLGDDAFRCHRLFRELLHAELEPAIGARLHRRAAALLEAEGRIGEAVVQAAAAGGPPAARDLLLRRWRELAAHERIDEARRAVAAAGGAAPPVAAAWVAAADGGPVRPAASRPRHLPFGSGDPELEELLTRVWFADGDVAAAERARALVAALPTVDPLLVAASSAALGRALAAAGRDEEALAALACLGPRTAAVAPAPTVRGLAVRARACARLGRPAAAAAAARTAASLVARHRLEATPAAALLREPAPAAPPEPARRSDLSAAELTVLRLLPTPLTQREIGRELYLSLNTVKTHAAAIYRKLGVSSRGEAVAAARRLNLLPG